MKQKKIYIISRRWAHDFDSDICIVGAFDNLEVAKRDFSKLATLEKYFCKEAKYTIDIDTDTKFSASLEGNSATNYISLRIDAFPLQES